MASKKTDLDYTDEKVVKAFKVYAILSLEPISVSKIIERIGFIPNIKVQLKIDSTTRILRTLKSLGFAAQNEATRKWSKGYKSF